MQASGHDHVPLQERAREQAATVALELNAELGPAAMRAVTGHTLPVTKHAGTATGTVGAAVGHVVTQPRYVHARGTLACVSVDLAATGVTVPPSALAPPTLMHTCTAYTHMHAHAMSDCSASRLCAQRARVIGVPAMCHTRVAVSRGNHARRRVTDVTLRPRTRGAAVRCRRGGGGASRGFTNLGNTCFANSVMQALMAVPAAVRYVAAAVELGCASVDNLL